MDEFKETYEDIFSNQIGSGSYWKNLFGDGFNDHKFIERSDALYICKRAQDDVYGKIIRELDGKIDITLINKIKQMLDEHWENDNSSLGITPNF